MALTVCNSFKKLDFGVQHNGAGLGLVDSNLERTIGKRKTRAEEMKSPLSKRARKENLDPSEHKTVSLNVDYSGEVCKKYNDTFLRTIALVAQDTFAKQKPREVLDLGTNRIDIFCDKKQVRVYDVICECKGGCACNKDAIRGSTKRFQMANCFTFSPYDFPATTTVAKVELIRKDAHYMNLMAKEIDFLSRYGGKDHFVNILDCCKIEGLMYQSYFNSGSFWKFARMGNVKYAQQPAVFVGLFHDVLMGVKTLLKDNYCHMDLNPGNLMVHLEQGKYRGKVIDCEVMAKVGDVIDSNWYPRTRWNPPECLDSYLNKVDYRASEKRMVWEAGHSFYQLIYNKHLKTADLVNLAFSFHTYKMRGLSLLKEEEKMGIDLPIFLEEVFEPEKKERELLRHFSECIKEMPAERLIKWGGENDDEDEVLDSKIKKLIAWKENFRKSPQQKWEVYKYLHAEFDELAKQLRLKLQEAWTLMTKIQYPDRIQAIIGHMLDPNEATRGSVEEISQLLQKERLRNQNNGAGELVGMDFTDSVQDEKKG